MTSIPNDLPPRAQPCLEDTTKLVRDRAYFLWERAGRPFGREHEFWAEASREIEGEADAERPDRIVAR